MKNVLLILLLNVSFLLNGQTKKVLFIGNSYTSGLPGVVSACATSAGKTLVYDSHTPGGERLSWHASSSIVENKIAANTWDYVSIQGQSQEMSWPLEGRSNSRFTECKTLSKKIRANYSCSTPLFYMTWGRKNGDSQNCSSISHVCTYEGMDNALQRNYLRAAEENLAATSPVAKVWRYLRNHHPEIELYSSDGSHPSTAGRYAAACSFYTIIFQDNPLNISYNGGVSSAMASDIRNAAKLVAFDSIADYHFGDSYPESKLLSACSDLSSCSQPRIATQSDTNFVKLLYGDQWFSYKADSSGELSIYTCGLTNLNTNFDVYTDCNSKKPSISDNCGNQEIYTFPVNKDEVYLVHFKSNFVNQSFNFGIKYLTAQDIHGNDCSDPIPANQGEVNHVNLVKGNKWFSYIADSTGDLSIYTCGLTNLNTSFYVYTDCDTKLSSGLNYCDNQENFELSVIKGNEYLILMRNLYTSGEFNFGIRYLTISEQASSCDQPKELREGISTIDLSRGNQFYNYTAYSDGQLTLSTCGITELDTYIILKSSCGQIERAEDDNCGGAQEEMIIPVVSGESYLFQLGDYSNGVFDLSTTFEGSVTLGFNEFDKKQLSIFPNPSYGIYHLSSIEENESWKVIDLQGVVIKEGKSSEVDISTFPSGVYLIETMRGVQRLNKL